MQFEYLLRTCTQVTSRTHSFYSSSFLFPLSLFPFRSRCIFSLSLSIFLPLPLSLSLSLSLSLFLSLLFFYFFSFSFFLVVPFFLRNPFIASYKAMVTHWSLGRGPHQPRFPIETVESIIGRIVTFRSEKWKKSRL